MKNSIISLLILCILLCGSFVYSQDANTSEDDNQAGSLKKFEKYGDFIVKGYSVTFSAGHFLGSTYLDNPILADRAAYTEGANDIIQYSDGESLEVSRQLYTEGARQYKFIYDSAKKEVEPGNALNLKIGVYIADNFHLDMAGTYISSRASTTMMHMFYDEDRPNVREEVDHDDGFKIYKGGLGLMYDAKSAKFFGITPRLGFGLGGVINRYSHLEDKTALYMEGNFALNYKLFKNLSLNGQVDYSTFAFQVDELGYSNMVHYTTFSLGASWFFDVLPADIRAQHLASQR